MLAFFLPQLVFVPLFQAAINRRAQSRILTKRGLSGEIVRAAGGSNGKWEWATAPIARVFALNMGIYKLKYTMNLLMNVMHHSAVAVALGVGGWLALEGRIEVGTVVAIVGGIAKLNDPWGDLVNWARELSVVEVKYRLFVDALRRLSGAVREPRCSRVDLGQHVARMVRGRLLRTWNGTELAMVYRTILALCDASDASASRLAFAWRLACSSDAHLIALHLPPLFSPPMTVRREF